jgi:glutamine amidotransferase-like uncharacterized protein
MLPLVNAFCGILLFLVASGCSDSRDGNTSIGDHGSVVASPGFPPARDAPTILLFNGRGTSRNDVAALEAILTRNHFSYSVVNSEHLNAMSEAQIRKYRLLIIPGGNFEQIGNGLETSTTMTIRHAVQDGLNYLGICAGAFFAGNSPYNGLDLTRGTKFKFYALESQGMRKAAVAITAAGSPTVDHYWEDGPQLAGWGDIVAKYPDGTPAVVEGSDGDGWVILAGIHPEAPESWRRGMTFATPTSESNAYATTLIDAALNRARLAHY